MKHFERAVLKEATESLMDVSVPVRFQDVDAAGILFFARFFDYAHEAYEVFLESCGYPLAEVIRKKEWAAPLRHAEADYISPAKFGDILCVQLVLAETEETEISLGFRVTTGEAEARRVVALVQTVHTFVSLPAFQRCPVPREIAERLTPGSR